MKKQILCFARDVMGWSGWVAELRSGGTISAYERPAHRGRWDAAKNAPERCASTFGWCGYAAIWAGC